MTLITRIPCALCGRLIIAHYNLLALWHRPWTSGSLHPVCAPSCPT